MYKAKFEAIDDSFFTVDIKAKSDSQAIKAALTMADNEPYCDFADLDSIYKIGKDGKRKKIWKGDVTCVFRPL